MKTESKVLCFTILTISIFLMICENVSAQLPTSRELAVELSATVNISPPKITLMWRAITYGTPGTPVYKIYKKAKTASSWGSILVTLPSNSTTYSDIAVTVDSAYEYKVEAVVDTITSTGFIYAGIKSPAIHNRGAMILLVDTEFSDSCSADLRILMNDLSGDGWQIIRHDISRTTSDLFIKSIIVNDYLTYENVNSVFIIGHLAVPYSGQIAPDNHIDHYGAWPSDLFYSTIGTTWTDNFINEVRSSYDANRNIPGDGKWDNSRISGESMVQISRLDFYDMPAFGTTEIQLLKRYLAKNHSYKMDSLNVQRRGLIYDGFGDGFGINKIEGFSANGWRNFSPLVSTDSITVAGYYQTINAMANTSYQWVYGSGGGTFTSLSHIGNTSDLAASPNKSIFTMFFGSYFGDWNVKNNFLRAMLCSNPPALTTCWAGRPNWFYHHMALGENIGYSAMITQNNYPTLYNTPIDIYNGLTHVELLGDLSLRSDYIKPPSNLMINSTEEGDAVLYWTPSPDPGVLGYYVYSSDSLFGNYQRLNTNIITSTTYNDTMVAGGLKCYMVRPVKLQVTISSGSYYNLGVGITNSVFIVYPVKNVTRDITYPTIQLAVNSANNGDIIEVDPGTYDEQVLVNRSVTIKGIGEAKPVIDFTGTVTGKPTILDISVPNVSIENLRIRVDMTKLNSAIIASASNIDNLNINNDSIESYASNSAAPLFGLIENRNAISINYQGATNFRLAEGGVNNISVTDNIISTVTGQSCYFRSGVSVDEGTGVFNNNSIQTLYNDLLVRFVNNGNIEIKNNILNGGGIELEGMNSGDGVLTLSNNIFDATFANSSFYGAAVLRMKNNYNSKLTLINGNTFINHQWAVSLENYNSVTLDSNLFTPLAGSTVYHHIAVNTKSISLNSITIAQVTVGAILTRNTFNSSGTLGGTALSFHNHDNDAASFGTFTVGSSGNENDFNNDILNFVYFDAQTGASHSSTFPGYSSFNYGTGNITTMDCWETDVNIENNKFDVGSGLQLMSSMNFANRNLLETALFHKPDNSCLGNLSFNYPAIILNIKVIPQGYYNTETQTLNKIDTVKAFLHLNTPPYNIIDSAIALVDSVTFTGSFSFSQPSGTYFISIKHRNTIETWSKPGGEIFTAGTIINYDFTDLANKSFGSNMTQVDYSPVRFAIYSGDVNQDGIIDASDLATNENDAKYSSSGFKNSDITGDNFVDASDLAIVENNSDSGIEVITP